jgi:hypothetical protein
MSWKSWRVGQTRKGWYYSDDRKQFLEWVENQLHVTHWTDWYTVTSRQIMAVGASGLLKHFNNSPSAMVSTIYPHHPWQIWKFIQTPKNWWDDLKNQRTFTDWYAQEEGIRSEGLQWTQEWEHVMLWKISKLGGSVLVVKYNNDLKALLLAVYPERAGFLQDFQQKALPSQNMLLESIQQVFS